VYVFNDMYKDRETLHLILDFTDNVAEREHLPPPAQSQR
jgi:hypothetical protein